MNDKLKDDIYYFSTMIEYIARKTYNHRNDVVSCLGEKGIAHELKVAEVNHCLSFEQVCDEWIEHYGITEGEFDTISNCKYEIPSVTAIGRVYQNLILADIDKNNNDISDAIQRVFASFISDYLSDFNLSVYYSSPDYLSCSYDAGILLV